MWNDLLFDILMRVMVHLGRGDDAKTSFHGACKLVCQHWLRTQKKLMTCWYTSSFALTWYVDTMAPFPSPHQIGKRLSATGKMEVCLFEQEPLRLPPPVVADDDDFPRASSYSPTSPLYSPFDSQDEQDPW